MALVVSIATAASAYFHPRRESRAANLTAYFYWNRELSRVDLPDGQSIGVGYNLVVWNQGPATAQDVRVEVLAPSGDAVELATVETGEFPLRRIDATRPVSDSVRSGVGTAPQRLTASHTPLRRTTHMG